jgi:hypothetical protein
MYKGDALSAAAAQADEREAEKPEAPGTKPDKRKEAVKVIHQDDPQFRFRSFDVSSRTNLLLGRVPR